jgi:tetratricopeptide (TPR) repeat protein
MVDQPKALREGLTTEHRVAILNKEAKSYISVGNYEAAITCCSTAISLNESNLAYLSRAHCYKNLKRWKEAISDYSAAIANDPSSSSTLCQRGLSYAKLEMYSEAIEDLSGAYIVRLRFFKIIFISSSFFICL